MYSIFGKAAQGIISGVFERLCIPFPIAARVLNVLMDNVCDEDDNKVEDGEDGNLNSMEPNDNEQGVLELTGCFAKPSAAKDGQNTINLSKLEDSSSSDFEPSPAISKRRQLR